MEGITVEKIQEDLMELINKDYNKEELSVELTKGTNIVTELMLNSVDALELLLKVEELYDIEIPDEDLNIDLLQNIEQLANYIYEL